MPEDWVGSYFDPCRWIDVPEPTLIARTATAKIELERHCRALFRGDGAPKLLSEREALAA